jgi:GNAT superfamily N-acetyltransferase
MTTTLRIVRAEPTPENLRAVLGLIVEAADWLPDKGTNQWAAPWPDERQRDLRVLKGLQVRKTWIVWDGDRPAATVTTATRANPVVWAEPYCQCNISERAVYAHRLITARGYSGLGLGAQLIEWAGLRARRGYGAMWIRIDVWTTNLALHDYYQNRGFVPCGRCPDPGYPSGALFQKPVAAIQGISPPHFTGASDFALPRVPAPARDAG